MPDFKEYIEPEKLETVVEEEHEPVDHAPMREWAKRFFSDCFGLDPRSDDREIREMYLESRRAFNGQGDFRVGVRWNGDHYLAEMGVSSKIRIEASMPCEPNNSTETIARNLIELCEQKILKNYNPDPNKHECQWTRFEWSKRGKSLMEVLDRVKSIPPVRTLLENTSSTPFSVAWVGWDGSDVDKELEKWVVSRVTSPTSAVYDQEAAQGWAHAHEDFINLNDGRDFLNEHGKYSVVVLCWLFNASNGPQPHYDGQYAMSPRHTKDAWVARLCSTGADYIFASGGASEVSGAFLGTLPGYESEQIGKVTEYTSYRKLTGTTT